MKAYCNMQNSATCRKQIFCRTGYLDDSGNFQPAMSQMATMTVTSLQLAIISGQLSSVQMLLSLVTTSEGKEDEAKLQFIGEPKASVDFDEGIWRFSEGDRMLHGCCAFFLSARFHARSLELFVELFKNKPALLQELIGGKRTDKCPEHPMKLSALHLAACNQETDRPALRYAFKYTCFRVCVSHMHFPHRILFDHVNKIDIRDARDFTPLHIASRASLEDNVLLLLEYGADPNAKGLNDSTPLHRAIKARIVQILIQYGADECLTQSSVREGRKQTALDLILEKNPSAAKVVLDDSVYTNLEDLTSTHLLLVFDLEVIFKSERSKDYLEMSLHKKLLNAGQEQLLEHPLSEAFLVLKSQLMRPFNSVNILTYLLYALLLTGLSWMSTSIRLGCERVHPFSLNECFTSKDSMFWPFWVLYVMTCILIILVITREIIQAYTNMYRYFRDLENWIEILMLILASLFVVTVVVDLHISPMFAAGAVLLAWFDFFLMLGRFPILGNYIYMFSSVTWLVFKFFFIFIWIMIGFAFCFHILLPSHNAFDNPAISFLKSLVMMSGEFEFEDNFTWEAVREAHLGNIGTYIEICIYNCSKNVTVEGPEMLQCIKDCIKGHNVSEITFSKNYASQFVFVLFFFLVSIVISNLLIGMTVNRTEAVEAAALSLRLERTLNQIVSLEDFLIKDVGDRLNKYYFNLINNTQMFSYLKMASDVQDISTNYKICIRPFEKVRSTWYKQWDLLGISTLLNLDGHFVYLYNEKSGLVGNRLKRLALPESIVTRSLKLVQERRQNILDGGLCSLTDPTRVKRRYTGGHVMGPLVINSKIVASDNAKFDNGNGEDNLDSVDAAHAYINLDDYD